MNKRVVIGVPVLAMSVLVTLVVALIVPSVGPFHDGTRGDDRNKRDRCKAPWPTGRPARAAVTGRHAGAGHASLSREERHRGPGAKRPSGEERDPSAQRDGSSKRPNVVVLMVDDMRADELSGPWMRNTRRLIGDQGARFSNSFSPLPLCGPARASFLSGRYAHNTGVLDNYEPFAFDRFDDRDTLPVWLNEAGYQTAFLGKYLNGYGGDDTDVPHDSYVPPGWDHWYGSLGGTTFRYRETKLSDNGHGVIDFTGRYQTSAYGDFGSQIISRLAAGDRPFFFNLSFSAPHTGSPRELGDPGLRTTARPSAMRGAYNDVIDELPGVLGEPCNAEKTHVIRSRDPLSRSDRKQVLSSARQRAEALATVDVQVRRLYRALRKSGELDNTYVIFTSDNGYFLGDFRTMKGKRLPYEPALRTPTLVRGPGIEPGIVREQPFTSIDFAPTIADMANTPPGKNVDGISLLPSATGRDRGWRRAILTASSTYGNEHHGRGIRLPGVLYEEYAEHHTRRELFDLANDPHQNYNVVDTRRYRRTRLILARLLDMLRDCQGEQCQRPLAQPLPGIHGDS